MNLLTTTKGSNMENYFPKGWNRNLIIVALICLCGRLGGNNVNSFSTLVELDFAIHKGEKGKIFAHSNSAPRMVFRTYLANKNVPCPNGLTARLFDSPTLSVGIPTITARPLTLFMCHCFLKLLKCPTIPKILPNFLVWSRQG